MAPTVAQAIRELDEAVPLSTAAAWDAVGLQVGDPDAGATRIGVCHEVTLAVIEAAIDSNVDLLVAYHPLLFRPAGAFVSGGGAAGRAYRLANAGVALHVVHTAFDVAAGGTADALAAAVALEDVIGFGPSWPRESAKVVTFAPADVAPALIAAMAAAGAGNIGQYSECAFSTEGVGRFRPGPGTDPTLGEVGARNEISELRIEMSLPAAKIDNVVTALVAAHPYDEAPFDVYGVKPTSGFVGRIGQLPTAGTVQSLAAVAAESLGAQVRIAGDPLAVVHRAAVVPGSGADLAGNAAAAGADVLLTGDVSHHKANDALAAGLAVIDAGHAATERPGMAKLYALVSMMFADTVDLTHLDPNPWDQG